MRPGIAPVEGEIVGVGHDTARRRLGMKNLIGDAMALAIGGRLFEGIEAQVHLLAHVARTGPAHQRLDLARLFGLIVEHPFLGLAGAGLHRSLRGLVYAGGHGLSLVLTVEIPRHVRGSSICTCDLDDPKLPRYHAPPPPRAAAAPRHRVAIGPAT